MDKILLVDCRFMTVIGVTEKEREHPQEISIDVELSYHKSNAPQGDKLDTAINYSEVHKAMKGCIEKNKPKLIETLAENLATLLLERFHSKHVTITIKKPAALRNRDVAYPAVQITRP